MPEITDSSFAAAPVADGVFMGAVAGSAAQFNTQDFAKSRTPVSITASGALAITALHNTVVVDSASAVNLTIPPVATVPWPLGAVISVFRKGAGAVQILAGSGVTRRSAGNKYKAASQYSVIHLRHVESDVWAIHGDTAA